MTTVTIHTEEKLAAELTAIAKRKHILVKEILEQAENRHEGWSLPE